MGSWLIMADVLRSLARSMMTAMFNGRRHHWPDEHLSRTAVVIAPHQDDEVLGCGGTILRKCDAGADVRLVFLTDGATSHSRLMPPEKMRDIRRQEALSAASILGVDQSAVTFVDVCNRDLENRLTEAADRIRGILDDAQPAEIFTPWSGEPPRDHSAAFEATMLALRGRSEPVTLHEYPVWLWQQWPWCRPEHYQPISRRDWWRLQWIANQALLSDFSTVVDVGDVLDRKRQALAAHRSQTTRMIDDPAWGILADVSDGEFMERLLQTTEIFKTTAVSSDR
jgi:LmbE family N-acetylglucosaminyl deacetylase